jgi:hypothetical protein
LPRSGISPELSSLLIVISLFKRITFILKDLTVLPSERLLKVQLRMSAFYKTANI